MLTNKVVLMLVGGGVIALNFFALALVPSMFGADINFLKLALANISPQAPAQEQGLPAGQAMTQPSNVSGTVTSTNSLSASLKVANAIAKYFSVPVSDVVALHNSGWGYGEIFKLYQLAKDSGKTVDEIKAMRESGMGWGVIEHTLGLPPGNHGKNLGGAVSGRNVTDTVTTTVGTKPPGKGNGNGNKDNSDKGKPDDKGKPNENGNGNGKGNGKP